MSTNCPVCGKQARIYPATGGNTTADNLALNEGLLWIPTAKRTPIDGRKVLVFFEGCVDLAHWDWDDKLWQFGAFSVSKEAVTHWQYLPLPPNDGGNARHDQA